MTHKASLLERLGGQDTIGRVVTSWYATVLGDPLLVPLFGEGEPHHVDHLSAFLVEVFGGPTRYTDEMGGFATLPASHRGLAIGEDQRQRFINLFLAAYDSEVPNADPDARAQFASYLEFGTEVAVVNSHATGDDDLHPCQVVPRWP